MNEIHWILGIIATIISHSVSADTLLGCGGFVKSHVPIDFSKVEVKLVTKQGILKDKINCAPTNGYYFVPLYDKGEYVLELEPPPGWSFTPTKVELRVDGVTDPCSRGEDINFVFKGFGITGQVQSFGTSDGPEGLEIELKSGTEVRRTFTSQGGNFFFTPVFPGNYIVKISNSKWKVLKESVQVIVAEGNTELPSKSLVIHGYDVKGTVKNHGEPIKDTTIVLYSLENKDVKVDGCEKSKLPEIQGKKSLCYVKSDEKGVFTFGAVPYGKYFVKPYYQDQNIYYQPESIEFTVEHGSVNLANNFEIIGFTVSGRVVKALNGVPVPNAKIYLDGFEVAVTNAKGEYKLEKLKVGTYSLRAETDQLIFKEAAVRVSPNVKQLPDLVPVAYQVCGNVISDKSQTITFSQVGSSKVVTTTSNPTSGNFCEFLTPGKYQVQVVLNTAHTVLQFFPKVQTIDITSEIMPSITFSQLKATVFGKIECLQERDCDELKAVLTPIGENLQGQEILIDVYDNSYKVADIFPGSYEISLSDNKFCWNTNRQRLNVNSVTIEVPTFVQTGYLVTFVASHKTEVTYKVQNNERVVGIAKGRQTHCLEKPGTYIFHMNSCHSYATETFTFNTASSNNEFFLNALKHTVTLFIESEKKYGEVTATINIDGVKTQTGALPYLGTGYEIRIQLSPSESAVIVPHSEILYFNPPILSVRGSSDCEALGVKFKAVQGVVFEGKVTPALSGVLVTIESDNSDTLIAETDEKGVYKFPALDKTKNYKVTAKKDSYVLVGPNKDGDFLAHKLAEIVIEVVDNTDGKPLQGTLLSLSGGESYRSNLQTNENGKITFHSLSPGDYFLRPMMKEYIFEPNSKIIKVEEGQTVNVQLLGKRVAYSAYGQITSLNKEPEENIIVVAQGVGNCSHFSEESSSESSGQFRIRGLQPFCSYDISIKTGSNEKSNIERSAPKKIRVEKVFQDVTDLNLIVFRPVTNLDLLVKVFAKNPDHYKYLRVKIIRENPSNVIYTSRIDTSSVSLSEYNTGVLVQVPAIPIDGKTYSVHLESSLNSKFEPDPEYFIANSSFKYIGLSFVVKSNAAEHEIKITSVWTLVFMFSIMLAVYNIDKINNLLKDKFGNRMGDLFNVPGKKPNGSDFRVDNDDIDQIVQSIDAIKRKPKSKKVQ